MSIRLNKWIIILNKSIKIKAKAISTLQNLFKNKHLLIYVLYKFASAVLHWLSFNANNKWAIIS